IINFTVGAKSNDLSLIPTNSTEYFIKKKEFYNRQKKINIKIKEILEENSRNNQHRQNQNQYMNKPITKQQEEELIQIINEFNNDFPQSLEINKTFTNTIIRDDKKPSLGNIWTYTPDIQLFLISLSTSPKNDSLNDIKNNDIDNKIDNNDKINANDFLPNRKRQKINKYKNIEINEVLKKIEVVLSHRTVNLTFIFFS
ncbi:hypothetical protein PIROE2DRAFT_15544, partial [Piromyces sp. E2]